MSGHPLAFKRVHMAPDQQTVEVGGHKFIAVNGEPGKCTGCYFPDGFGRALWRRDQKPLCRPQDRQDGRGIVWVAG